MRSTVKTSEERISPPLTKLQKHVKSVLCEKERGKKRGEGKGPTIQQRVVPG